ncbi:PepSY-associated TM helix domain-containing protein [Achromobacter denitrificans]
MKPPRSSLRRWSAVHKWSSLAATLWLLLLCLTGLPLVFHDEIETAMGMHPELPAPLPGAPAPSLDRIVADAQAAQPGSLIDSLGVMPDAPALLVTLRVTDAQGAEAVRRQVYSLLDGRPTALPPPRSAGAMEAVRRLHTDMYAGLPGTLFLGGMALLLAVAMVSGIALYGPFMRKRPFGSVRRDRNPRVRWLDLHNFLGIAAAAWIVVIALTGVINSLHDPLAALWRTHQLADMVNSARQDGQAPPERFASVDAAVDTVLRAAPGMTVASVFFPGAAFSSSRHYAVFLRGATPVSSRLLKPALVDAETGVLTAMEDMPWYTRALFLSQPLHFGDYGGLPLKIIWAALDIVAIAVLVSGLYLWRKKYTVKPAA